MSVMCDKILNESYKITKVPSFFYIPMLQLLQQYK